MKCIRCNKPLKAFAKQVMTDDGPAGWGPTCARLAFATQRRQPAGTPAAKARHRPGQANPAQIDWLEQVAA
jgi:hypothetical protein